VSSLADSNNTHNTIKVYLAAIRQLHIQCGHTMTSGDHMPWVNQVLKGIKIRQVSKEILLLRSPFTPCTLHQIKEAWEKEEINNDRVMLWVAFVFCFFASMCSKELCPLVTVDLTLQATSPYRTLW